MKKSDPVRDRLRRRPIQERDDVLRIAAAVGVCLAASASAESVEDKRSPLSGSIEFGLAFAPEASGVAVGKNQSRGMSGQTSAAPLVTPGLDWNGGRNLRIGLEANLISIDDPFGFEDRATAFGPCGRLQMTWPIGEKFVVPVTFALGLSFMDAGEESSLRGWMYRAGIGGEYEIDETIIILGSIGTVSIRFWPDGDPFTADRPRESQLTRFNSLYLSLGARTGW